MASEMGSEELESETEKLEEVESSYRIVYHQGSKLPEEYKNLIIAPFLNSLRYGNDLYKLIDKDAYFLNYSHYIDILLARPMTIVKLAMLKDNTILGWSLVEHKTVHYVWVKKEVRRQGICRALLPKEFTTISHITHKGINIWVKHFPEVGFNPWA
jgi:hypothetical protein